MKRKFYTLVLTFLCLFFGQVSYGQGQEGGFDGNNPFNCTNCGIPTDPLPPSPDPDPDEMDCLSGSADPCLCYGDCGEEDDSEEEDCYGDPCYCYGLDCPGGEVPDDDSNGDGSNDGDSDGGDSNDDGSNDDGSNDDGSNDGDSNDGDSNNNGSNDGDSNDGDSGTDDCPSGDYCLCYGDCGDETESGGNPPPPPELKNWYLDNDGDGYDAGKQQKEESPGQGWVEGTSKGMDCDDNKYHPNNNCSVLDPCALVKAQIANATWLNQLNILRGKTGLTNESGYAEQISNTQPFQTLTSSGNDHLNFPISKNIIGYMHTHLDPYEITDPDGEIKEVKPIQMFSPNDIINFLRLLLQSYANQKPLEDIYGVMVSSTGTYELKFTGNIEELRIANANIPRLKERKIKAAYTDAIEDYGNEGGLIYFMQNTFKFGGVELMAIGKDNSVSKVTKGADGKGVKVPCAN